MNIIVSYFSISYSIISFIQYNIIVFDKKVIIYLKQLNKKNFKIIILIKKIIPLQRIHINKVVIYVIMVKIIRILKLGLIQ